MLHCTHFVITHSVIYSVMQSYLLTYLFVCLSPILPPSTTVTCLTSSVLTLSAISCDRYMAIMFPLRSRVTKKRTDAVIAAIWVCSLVISTPFFLFRRLQTLYVGNTQPTKLVRVTLPNLSSFLVERLHGDKLPGSLALDHFLLS